MKDSSGNFGSTAVSLNTTPNTSSASAPTSTSSAGFYADSSSAPTTGWYCDGAGHVWTITCDANGGIFATATVGGVDINGGALTTAVAL